MALATCTLCGPFLALFSFNPGRFFWVISAAASWAVRPTIPACTKTRYNECNNIDGAISCFDFCKGAAPCIAATANSLCLSCGLHVIQETEHSKHSFLPCASPKSLTIDFPLLYKLSTMLSDVFSCLPPTRSAEGICQAIPTQTQMKHLKSHCSMQYKAQSLWWFFQFELIPQVQILVKICHYKTLEARSMVQENEVPKIGLILIAVKCTFWCEICPGTCSWYLVQEGSYIHGQQ